MIAVGENPFQGLPVMRDYLAYVGYFLSPSTRERVWALAVDEVLEDWQLCGEISEDEHLAGRPLLSAIAMN